MLNPYTQILRLARSGSPERAWSLMAEHGLLDSASDPKALTLQARLVKDRAKRAGAGSGRARLFDQSAQLYARAAEIARSSYPLINAASLSLFAGKPVQARRFAEDVLDLIAADPAEGETPYWREATRAEALLLLDHEAEARAALGTAMARQPHAWEDHAATIQQFALILAEKGWDAAWLDMHRPPPSIHFSGITGLDPDASDVVAAIAQFIASERPGFAFGALAAGADLLFAEAFTAWRDAECPAAELHVVLPYPVDQFRQISVAAFGDRWTSRFDEALAQASTVTAYGLGDPKLPLAVDYADRVAMGRAVRNAQVLASQAGAVTVLGKGEGLRPQLASWRDSGRPLTIIEAARSADSRPSPDIARQSLQTFVWADQQTWSIHADLLSAATEARRLASAGTSGRAAILVAPGDPDDAPSPLLQRAAALAAVANPGTVVSDEPTAMALVLAGWDGTVEELGELPLPSGREPIWSVI
ncbi:tetratricopeptide repeat-containing protein [Blastomonas sp. CCH1-A6]|uniref:tetratricopeptide repeat-containing protein n=1 Tax=unclassified Blastomonas TaxID=2626550 RepID=UPI000A7A5152